MIFGSRAALVCGAMCLSAVLFGGCAITTDLTPQGADVNTNPTQDVSGCEHLGLLSGQGGGQFGGAYIANDKLLDSALNDLRNKAARKGATHVIVASGSDSDSGGARHTTNLAGNAYRCSK